MKESDKKEVNKVFFKVMMLYIIVSSVSSCFSSMVIYTKNKFEIFMALFLHIVFSIYLIKKIIHCRKEKKLLVLLLLVLLMTYAIFLFFSFCMFCILCIKFYRIFTSK